MLIDKINSKAAAAALGKQTLEEMTQEISVSKAAQNRCDIGVESEASTEPREW